MSQLEGSRIRGLRKITVAAGALVALSIGPAAAAHGATGVGPTPACTKVAGAAEQSAAGFRAFVSGLLPGEVGCLAPGTYGAVNERFVMATGRPGLPVTLRAQNYAAKPTIVGELLLGGDSITASGLIFDGPAGCDSPPPQPCTQMAPVVINGHDDQVDRSEIENSASHEGIAVGDDLSAPAPAGVRLLRDYVHDNGVRADRSRANLDHGINWSRGSGLIANSVIAHNYAYGIHLAPYATNVRVTLDTIVGNGRSGVIIADCDPRENTPSAALHCTTQPGVDLAIDNLVDNNIIADNCTDPAFSAYCFGGVASYLLDARHNGNRVRDNLFFHNYLRRRDQACDGRPGCTPKGLPGLAFSGNFNRDPMFVGGPRWTGAARFALRAGSPAIGRAVAAGSHDLTMGDFAGRPRPGPRRTRPDLGAFENTRKPR